MYPRLHGRHGRATQVRVLCCVARLCQPCVKLLRFQPVLAQTDVDLERDAQLHRAAHQVGDDLAQSRCLVTRRFAHELVMDL